MRQSTSATIEKLMLALAAAVGIGCVFFGISVAINKVMHPPQPMPDNEVQALVYRCSTLGFDAEPIYGYRNVMTNVRCVARRTK